MGLSSEVFKKIEKNPVAEVKRRFSGFMRQLRSDQGECDTTVDNIIVSNAHAIRLRGVSKDYSIDIIIGKRF